MGVYYESIKEDLNKLLIFECRCDGRLKPTAEGCTRLGWCRYIESLNAKFVYYESIKRELNKRLIFDCRCDARLKAKAEGCSRLVYTMWCEEP